MLLENTDGIFFSFGCKRWCAFEGIGNAEFLIFVGSHGVVGEYLYFLDDATMLGNVLGKCIEMFVVVGESGNNNMAYPRGFLNLLQIVEQLLVGCSCVAGNLLVKRFVKGFDVEQYEVGALERLLDVFVENGSACVDGSVESFLFAKSEKLCKERCLHEWLSACASDSSFSDEVFIAFDFINEFFRCHLVGYFSLWIPCVGVVAEGTSHGTALEKGYKPNSRAIYCAEGLDAVKPSLHAIEND